MRHGDERVFEWATNRVSQMFEALKTFETNLATGRVGHDGTKTLGIAVANARKVARPGQKYILGKATESQKIDIAMAMVLAHEAWVNSMALGWAPREQNRVLVFGRRRR